MRPPRIAAEYDRNGYQRAILELGFNEAAANRGGIPGRQDMLIQSQGGASMRPPRIAAEYVRSCHSLAT